MRSGWGAPWRTQTVVSSKPKLTKVRPTGAPHYFPAGFRDPYVPSSDKHEEVYHLEATTSVIMGLNRFCDARPDHPSCPGFRALAKTLWFEAQRFVTEHGFPYSTHSIRHLMTPLESATAALWYLKTARYIGQEGELHRLEKALMDGTRVDLADGYENPAVGSLADEVLRVFDDWVAAVQNSKKSDQKVSSSGSELIGVVMDACSWNATTLDQINAQGASLERLGLKIGQFAESNGDSSADADDDVYAEAVAGIEEDLEALAEAIESLPDADAASQIVDLVDQTSKLTFQIAMETARLGDQGQKLLPMTQDLEELITEARDLTGGRKRKSGRGSKFGRLFKRVRKRLAVLGTGDESQPGATDIADALTGEIGPLTKKISESVRSIAHNFNLQTDRLIQLGTSVGELTGEEFDSSEIESGDPMNPPTGELAVDAFDPFNAGGKQTDPEQAGLVSDPFASAPNSPLEDPPSADDAARDSAPNSSTEMSPALAGFSLDATVEDEQDPAVEPAESTEPADSVELAESAEPGESAEPAEAAKSDEIGVDPAEPSAAAAEVATDNAVPLPSDTVALSVEDDQVYDLAELGAVPLDEGADPAPAEDDRIYELSELGAVAVN